MRKTMLFFFFLLAQTIEAQIFTPDTNAYKSFIQVDIDFEYENGAFNNEFIDLIFSDEFIPLEKRIENLNKQNLKNEFGLNFIQNNEAYLGMIKPFKKNHSIGVKFGIDWRFSMFGAHSDDFMSLLFRGNNQFLDQNANAGSTEINIYNHQRFKFGFYNKRNHSFLNLAIGKGTRFNQLIIEEGGIATQSDGAEIDFNLTGEYLNAGDNNWYDFNGKSISIDAKHYFVHKPTERRKFLNILSLEIGHLGFMHWKGLDYSRIDTSFTFDGIGLGNFLEDSFTFPDQSALEDSINVSTAKQSHLQFLPYNVLFQASSLRESGLSYGFEVDYWGQMKMTPNIRFQLGYLARRNFKMNSEFSIGGYQNAKFGLWIEWEINYSWYWKIGTHHIIDNFNNNGLGRSMFINLKRDIR